MPLTLRIESELDERSATAAADRAQRIYTQASQDMSRSLSEGLTRGAREGGQAIEEMANRARGAYGRVGDATDELRDQERQLRQMREDGSRGVEVQAERVRQARKREKEAIREAAAAYDEYERAARGAGQAGEQAGDSMVSGLRSAAGQAASAGREAAEGFAGGFAGAGALARLGAAGGPVGMALAGIAALGFVGGRELVSQIEQGMASMATRDLFQARLGVDPATMSRYGAAAREAFTDSFGSSVPENLRTVQFAIQGGVIGRDATNAEIETTIAHMDTLAQLMEVDVQEASRAAGQLMRGGFAADGTAAADIIASGFQRGLDISGDWLDTITEYSTQFRKLGLDGDDALGLIQQGLEGAARDSDVVADSLKEFSIRAVDGSKATAEGFSALGFDPDEMGRRFAAGGETARAAFQQTITAIRSLQDPLQQGMVWTRLFGTQFEDMGDAINRMDLSTARGQFADTEGAINSATGTLAAHTSEWDRLGRNIDTTFSKLREWLADSAIGDFFGRGVPGFFNNLFGAFGDRPAPVDSTGLPVTDTTTPRDPNPADAGTWGDLMLPPGSPRPPDNGLPGPLGLLPSAPPPPPPVPQGAPTPILTDTESQAAKDAEAAAKSAEKPVIDPSRYMLDSVPLGGFPGAPGGGPSPMLTVGGMPSAAAGPLYAGQVDPNAVWDAESQVIARRASVENARLAVLEMEQEGTATESQLAAARRQVLDEERGLLNDQTELANAQMGLTDKLQSNARDMASGMDQLGAALDPDFGISRGLAGLAENLVRFVGNLGAAPMLTALGAISAANPSQGGYGLMGMLGARGVFGPQFTGIDTTDGTGRASTSRQVTFGGGAADVPSAGLGGNASAMIALARSADGGAYGYGASDLAQGLADCSGAISDLYEVMTTGQATARREFTTESDFEALGFRRGFMPGALNIGVHNGGGGRNSHMAATLPNGVNFESGGAHGGIAYGGPAAGALDPQFENQYYLPLGGNPTMTASGAAPSLYSPPSTTPGAAPTTRPAVTPGGGTGMGIGPGMAGPPMSSGFGAGPLPGPTQIGGVSPVASGGGGGGGIGMTPGGTVDTALGMAATAADVFAPGAGQAAQMGIKLANRAIQYGGQVAAIGVGGLMETFLPTGGSELANNNWLTRIAGGIAGAAPALPNLAGGKQGQQQLAPQQATAQHGQGGTTNNTTNIEVHNERASEDGTGRDIAYHQAAAAQAPGM